MARIPGCAGDICPIEVDVLNTALAKARGTLEFDAHQRAYGGHVHVGDAQTGVTIVPLRHGVKATGLLAAGASELNLGALGRTRRRRRDCRRTHAVSRGAGRCGARSAEGGPCGHASGVPEPQSQDAVDGGPRRGREPSRRTDTRQSRRAGQSRGGRARPPVAALFQDILDMARVDASAILVERQWVTAAEVIDAAMAQVRHALAGRTVNVAADTEMVIDLDPRLASGALSHLLENAAQYSPANSEIVVTGRAEPDGLHASVVDHGPGLDAGELDHLFERFYRGRTARRLLTRDGNGARHQSWTVGCCRRAGVGENEPGAGARFSMVVPWIHPPRRGGALSG